MEHHVVEERFTWTSALIDALLAFRFKDDELCGNIDRAKGNEAKRKAWMALAQRFQKDQGVSVPESKLRRVISKWQSQHRAWTQAIATKSADELALMERPPTYMPVLQRYFKEDAATNAASKPTVIPRDDAHVAPPSTENFDKPVTQEHQKRPERPPIAHQAPEPQQRKLSPPRFTERPRPAIVRELTPPNSMERSKEPPRLLKHTEAPVAHRLCSPLRPLELMPEMPMSTHVQSVFASPRVRKASTTVTHPAVESQETDTMNNKKARLYREQIARVTQRLSDIQQAQLTLQKKHFEEQLALQRKQYDEQFAVQRKQVEAVHAVMESLHGSIAL